jgi:hypothetical protein
MKPKQIKQRSNIATVVAFVLPWSSGGIILKYEDKSERNQEKKKKTWNMIL